MYLLMLLAAFISQMYGFNLSARPDYDRDIAVKKAHAVIYKFLFQEGEVKKLLIKVASGKLCDTALPCSALPNDMIYAHFDAVNGECDTAHKGGYINDTTLYYQPTDDKRDEDSNKPKPYFMRKRTDICQDTEDNINVIDEISVGRQFFNSNRMISRVICTDADLQESTGDGAKDCKLYNTDDEGEPIMVTDPYTGEMVPDWHMVDGHLKSCCSSGRRFLISYMKLDPRWINRVTQEVSFDLLKAVSVHDYTENIGVITWHDGSAASDKYWLFRGKLHFRPAYIDAQNEWVEDHPGVTYPVGRTRMGEWKLPKYFTEGYFTDITQEDENFCKPACLMKIQAF